MKSKRVYLVLAALLLTGGGTFIYLFCGPYRFVDSPLAAESLQHLRASASGASWAASPAETAYEYFYWWPQIDRPNRSKLDITSSQGSSEEVIVTVIDNDCRDDSIWRSFDRLTMHRESGIWIPVRHQSAWQGPGRVGRTTQPTR